MKSAQDGAYRSAWAETRRLRNALEQVTIERDALATAVDRGNALLNAATDDVARLADEAVGLHIERDSAREERDEAHAALLTEREIIDVLRKFAHDLDNWRLRFDEALSENTLRPKIKGPDISDIYNTAVARLLNATSHEQEPEDELAVEIERYHQMSPFEPVPRTPETPAPADISGALGGLVEPDAADRAAVAGLMRQQSRNVASTPRCTACRNTPLPCIDGHTGAPTGMSFRKSTREGAVALWVALDAAGIPARLRRNNAGRWNVDHPAADHERAIVAADAAREAERETARLAHELVELAYHYEDESDNQRTCLDAARLLHTLAP